MIQGYLTGSLALCQEGVKAKSCGTASARSDASGDEAIAKGQAAVFSAAP
jgi:hypothetical protein